MVNRKAVLSVAGAILGLALAVTSAEVWASPDRATTLTFNHPVGLPGVTLGSGSYVFELAVSSANPLIVRVSNNNGTIVFYTGFTEQIARPLGMPADRQILLGEASAGAVPPITAWFPAGDSVGYKFKYDRR
jgi:hypothetical protein